MNIIHTHGCFLGIDIAKNSFNTHLLRADGGRDQAAEFTNDPVGFAALDAWLLKHAVVIHDLQPLWRPPAPMACRC